MCNLTQDTASKVYKGTKILICTSSVPGDLDKNMDDWRVYRETVSLVYGACVLVFGGIGLVAAFITELKLSKK